MTSPMYRRSADLMEAELGDELVALDAQAGNCYGFNTVAAAVWRSLAEPKSFDELTEVLVAQFEVSPERCASDLRQLVDELIGRGLIGEA